MDVQFVVKRKTIAITFSREFEALLLNYASEHLSLTHDLELAATHGLQLLEELEDARDIKHAGAINRLVTLANKYGSIDSSHFPQWYINISEDLLDEIDLLILLHGDDLKKLGLATLSQGSVIVMLALAGIYRIDLR